MSEKKEKTMQEQDKYYRPEAMDDFAKSLTVSYDHIRDRVAAGGERGWMDKK